MSRAWAFALLAAVALAQTGRVAGGEEESAFFRASDTDRDGMLSKKEFYTAVMEEGFERIAERHGFSAVDMEFSTVDLDGSRRISAEEWDTVFWALEAADEEPEPAKEEEPVNEWQEEEDFFRRADEDDNGSLKKKEFYNAIMSDAAAFERISAKQAFSALDVDFALADTNNDGRVTQQEWMALFYHGLPQKPEFKDGKSTVKLPESDSTELVGPGGPTMRVHSEMEAPKGERYYFGKDISWMEANEYCSDRRLRLCEMRELCPDVRDNLSAEQRKDLFAPISGNEHHWADLDLCGRAMKVADKRHDGIVACCSLTPPPIRKIPAQGMPAAKKAPAEPTPPEGAAPTKEASPQAAEPAATAAVVTDDAGDATGAQPSETDRYIAALLHKQSRHGAEEAAPEAASEGARAVEGALWGGFEGQDEVSELLQMQQELHARAGARPQEVKTNKGTPLQEGAPSGDGGEEEGGRAGDAVEAAAHSVRSAEERLRAEHAGAREEPAADAEADGGVDSLGAAVEMADESVEVAGQAEGEVADAGSDAQAVDAAPSDEAVPGTADTAPDAQAPTVDAAQSDEAVPETAEAGGGGDAGGAGTGGQERDEAAKEAAQEHLGEKAAKKEKKKKEKREKKASAGAAGAEGQAGKKEKKSKKEKKKEKKAKQSAERVLLEEPATEAPADSGSEEPAVRARSGGSAQDAWGEMAVEAQGAAAKASGAGPEVGAEGVNYSRGGKVAGGFPEGLDLKDEAARLRRAQEELPKQSGAAGASWGEWASGVFGSGKK